MSATESIYAPYLDRKAKLALAGIATGALAFLLSALLVVSLILGFMILGPLVPSGPTEWAYLMSVHHALPTWGCWLLLWRYSPMVIVVIVSWLAVGFLAIDTFNLAMAIFRFIYIDVNSMAFLNQIIIFILLLAFWLITALATAWTWRVLRFKAKRRRSYLNDEVELLSGHRRSTAPKRGYRSIAMHGGKTPVKQH